MAFSQALLSNSYTGVIAVDFGWAIKTEKPVMAVRLQNYLIAE
jgi:hypothetical protein